MEQKSASAVYDQFAYEVHEDPYALYARPERGPGRLGETHLAGDGWFLR